MVLVVGSIMGRVVLGRAAAAKMGDAYDGDDDFANIKVARKLQLATYPGYQLFLLFPFGWFLEHLVFYVVWHPHTNNRTAILKKILDLGLRATQHAIYAQIVHTAMITVVWRSAGFNRTTALATSLSVWISLTLSATTAASIAYCWGSNRRNKTDTQQQQQQQHAPPLCYEAARLLLLLTILFCMVQVGRLFYDVGAAGGI